jgi:monoamine oxidase
LGGQWIGPEQKRISRLVREYEVATFPTAVEGVDMNVYSGTRHTEIPTAVDELFTKLDTLSSGISLETPWLHPQAAMWDRLTFASWLTAEATEPAAAKFVGRGIAGGLLASDAGDVSLLEVLFYVASGGGVRSLMDCEGGAQQTRIVGGPHAVAKAMAADLSPEVVLLNQPVRAIRQTANEVTVITDKSTYHASRAIVAIPPVLAGRIDYSPALPAIRDGLTQHMPAGYALKMHALYDRPFWRDAGWNGIALTDEGPVAETFDNSPPDSSYGALAIFVYGADARKLRSISVDEQRREVLEHLMRLYGPKASRIKDFISFDWTAEPWTRGCFSGHFTPGGWLGYGSALRQPVGRLHWAGTETATHWNGYIDGAVESGERAAQEIITAQKSGDSVLRQMVASVYASG